MNDNAPDTRDDNLAEWVKLALPLQNAKTQADEAIEATQNALSALWDKAEASGDEDAKGAITVAWHNAQRKRDIIHQADAALSGAAAIMGGLVSAPAAVVGGLLMGVLESFTSAFLSSGLRDAVAFLILFVVLLRGRGR